MGVGSESPGDSSGGDFGNYSTQTGRPPESMLGGIGREPDMRHRRRRGRRGGAGGTSKIYVGTGDAGLSPTASHRGARSG